MSKQKASHASKTVAITGGARGSASRRRASCCGGVTVWRSVTSTRRG